MPKTDRPQICLITPPAFEIQAFSPLLARVLDRHRIGCLRLALAGADDAAIARAADSLRELAHARDVAVVVQDHIRLVEAHGLDGVHLTETRRPLRKVRDDLGPDAIIGAFCGATRHEGITASEAGADYVAFGPVGESVLGDGAQADMALFSWWSEMIEVPVIAEGALTQTLVECFAPVTDFFGIGAEIWSADDPSDALSDLIAPLD